MPIVLPGPACDAVAPACPLECGGAYAQVGSCLLEPQPKLGLKVLKGQLATSTHRPVEGGGGNGEGGGGERVEVEIRLVGQCGKTVMQETQLASSTCMPVEGCEDKQAGRQADSDAAGYKKHVAGETWLEGPPRSTCALHQQACKA